jgi:hypothetical protein
MEFGTFLLLQSPSSESPDRTVQHVPLPRQLFEQCLTGRADRVELARPRLLGVPLAGQQALFLQPPQQRVERVPVHREPGLLQGLQQGVAVVRPSQRGEAGQHHRAAPQFLKVSGQELLLLHTSHNSVRYTP